MAKIADSQGINWLGSKWNQKQFVLGIPGGNTANTGGIVYIERIDSSGDPQSGVWLHTDGTNLRMTTGSTKPSNTESGGSVIGSAGADTALSNIASVQIPNGGDLIPANADQVSVGTAAAYMSDIFFGADLYHQTATFDTKLSFTTPSADRAYTFPDVAADGEVMINIGAANVISLVKGSSTLVLNANADLDIAAGKTVDINAAVTIGATAALTTSGSNAIVLDQRVATTASPTFVAVTCQGITSTTTLFDVSVTGSNVAAIQIGADDQYITFGASDATDSRIYYNGAALTFYDSVSGALTLAQLSAGTPLNPIVVGDLTIGEGMIECDTTQDITTYFKRNNATGTNAVVEIENSHATPTSPTLLLDSDCTADADVLSITNAGTGYSVSTTLGATAGEGIEVIFATGGTANGIFLDGSTGTYVGASGSGMLHIHQTGTLAQTDATCIFINFDGTYAANGEGACLLIDDNGTASSTNYSVSINSNAVNAMKVVTANAGMMNLVMTGAANQTVQVVDIDTQWIGTNNVGCVEIDSDGVIVAGANLLRISGTGANEAQSYLAEIVSTGNVVTSTDGICLRIDESGTAAGTSYAAFITSTANAGLGVSISGVGVEAVNIALPAAHVVNGLAIVGDYDGASGKGMISATSTGTHVAADTSLFIGSHSTGAPAASARGSILRLVDTTSNAADAWVAFISSTNNDGLLIDTGAIADINLKLTGVTAQEASMMVIAGDTTAGWEGEPNAGMLHINAIGARSDTTSSLLLISDITGASVASGRGTSMRIVDATTVGADSWVGYIKTTANDGLLIETGHIDGKCLWLKNSTAGVDSTLHVDGATGGWVGVDDTGLLHLDNDGTQVTGAGMIHIAKTGATGANMTGSCLEIQDASTGGSTSGYAAYINASGALEALHVVGGLVLVDEVLTATKGLVSLALDTNVTTPPTDAELDAVTDATQQVAGFIGIVDDADAHANVYVIVHDGTKWWQATLTACA